jgi:hypothetical protein
MHETTHAGIVLQDRSTNPWQEDIEDEAVDPRNNNSQAVEYEDWIELLYGEG